MFIVILIQILKKFLKLDCMHITFIYCWFCFVLLNNKRKHVQ